VKKTVLLLLVISLVSCIKDSSKKNSSNLFSFLPNNPSVIVHSNSLEELNSFVSENELIQQFSSTKSYTDLASQFTFTKELDPNNELLIGFSKVGKDLEYILATKKSNEKLNRGTKKQYNRKTFYEVSPNTFTLDIDSTTIISSSELLIENLIRNRKDNINYNNNSLNKLIKTNSENKNTLYINLEKKPNFLNNLLPSSFLSHNGWTSFSFSNENGINSNGTATSKKLTNELASNISQLENNKTNASSILPYNFSNYTSYHYNELLTTETDFENFSELISNSNELVLFSDSKNRIIAFSLLENDVIDNLTEVETYRNASIYQNTYYKIPASIIKPQPEFACIIDNFLLLSSKKEALQNVIAHYQNKTTLAHQPFYKETIADALRESHINISKKTTDLLLKLSDDLDDSSIKKVNLKDFPLFTQQISYEDNYININTFIKKTSVEQQKSIGVSQIANIRLDSPVNPKQIHWVKNHRTKEQELLVQDMENNLYLISKKGTILWKKKLNNEIQGKVHQVDLYKNRKLQLAFTTLNEFMVLDRNGKLVEPYSKKLNNNLQPLSVFDYDNNRNYRFILAYDNKIEMYDNKMKTVKGFKFNKTKSTINSSPRHIRIGTKDYIVLTEENGKLHILNRQGKDRTKVKTKFDFNKTLDIHTYKNHLIFIDTNETVNKVNVATGNVTKEDMLNGTTNYFNQLDAIKVKLEDQNLSIKDKNFELEFGSYTKPRIFYQNKKYYISTTDTETQQVFIFDRNAKLMSKFPVYGKGEISLHKNLFATQGEENNVLIYKM